MIITPNNYFIFPGGEVHCSKLSSHESILCLDYTMNGFMALCEFAQMNRNKNVKNHVTYPYFPYARQDRYIDKYEPFSLKIFCDLINQQKFDSITIWDPHSDVAGALLENCEIIPQWRFAKTIIQDNFFTNRNVLFVSPDAGAYKKLSKLIDDDTRICIGVKNRNYKGEITSTDVFSSTPIQGHECFIVDDICDGGRTFIELAKVLKQKGATKIYLYVTHGIFSKGIDVLKEYIDHVWTTDSFPNISTDFLTVDRNF